jgi:hypothetical protein
MSDQKQEKVDSNDARQASMSRVVTQDTLFNQIASAQPASEAVSEEKKEEAQEVKEDKPKEKQSRQERMQFLANKRREAENREKEAKRENDELRARIKALEAVAPPIQEEDRPKRINFASEDDYIEALTDWKAKKAVVEGEQQKQQARLAAEEAERNERYISTVESAKTRYDDFEKVVGSARIAIPPYVALAIKESEIGGDLTYYLAKHQDEVKKLIDLNPVKAVKYLDRLERDLLADEEDAEQIVETVKPEAKKKAPEPISPVKGMSALPSSPAKDFEEYRARRKAQMRRG